MTRIPPRLPSGWPSSRSRLSYSRTQDARSEASVKDKIAMFSNDRAISSERLDKYGTLPSKSKHTVTKISTGLYLENYKDVKSLDRRLTKSQDNLDDMPMSRSYKRHGERPEALGGLENTISILNVNNINKNFNSSNQQESKPLFYGSTNTLPSNINSKHTQMIYHSRSNSDDSNKSSHKLEYLIEQRKKSTSKLRALMIPESQAPIVDLPEIRVENPLVRVFTSDIPNKSKQQSITNQSNKNIKKNVIDLKNNWKDNLITNNIPKYSPAFKRKSLQLYNSAPSAPIPEVNVNESSNNLNLNKSINKSEKPIKPPRQSVDLKYLSQKNISTYGITSENILNVSSNNNYNKYKNIGNKHVYKDMEIKICTITDVVDSDNDSAMSSTQSSSYRSSASSPLHNMDSIESDSSHLSPGTSNFAVYTVVKTEAPVKDVISNVTENYEKRSVCRSVSSDTNVSLSSSAGSAATSGSQASCSSLESAIADSDKRKITKVYDIDSINRKNILASAKCRSGRDNKLNSPVVDTKFSQDIYDRCTGTSNTMPERFSTLTSTVSAISIKGENRRRNKVIAASDSDTDNEVTIRQRKAEFKNARLKRNSSSSTKSKLSDISTEPPKSNNDEPQYISERIIKEIKKAGLDNYESKTKPNLHYKIGENKLKRNLNDSSVPLKIENKSPNTLSNKIVKDSIPKIINSDSQKPINVIDVGDESNIQQCVTKIVRLQKGTGTGIGLILAGGIDCEAKDVTVSFLQIKKYV